MRCIQIVAYLPDTHLFNIALPPAFSFRLWRSSTADGEVDMLVLDSSVPGNLGIGMARFSSTPGMCFCHMPLPFHPSS